MTTTLRACAPKATSRPHTPVPKVTPTYITACCGNMSFLSFVGLIEQHLAIFCGFTATTQDCKRAVCRVSFYILYTAHITVHSLGRHEAQPSSSASHRTSDHRLRLAAGAPWPHPMLQRMVMPSDNIIRHGFGCFTWTNHLLLTRLSKVVVGSMQRDEGSGDSHS